MLNVTVDEIQRDPLKYLRQLEVDTQSTASDTKWHLNLLCLTATWY
jgi:hypothetical protein